MTRLSGFCCLLLICSSYQVCMGNPFMVAVEVYEKAMLVYDTVDKIQEFQKLDEPSNTDLYDKLKDLSNDFQDLKDEVLKEIANLPSVLKEKTKEFFSYTKNVESKYEFLLTHLQHPGGFELSTVQKFANESVRTDFYELTRTLEKMYQAFVDHDFNEESLLSVVTKNSTAVNLICIKHQSKQQLINNLYKAFVESSTKGLMVLLFSYETLAKYEDRKYQLERKEAKDKFQTRINRSFKHYKDALKMSSREMYRCDPPQPGHQKGVTYDKLQQVLQAYFVKETDTANMDGRVNLAKAIAKSCTGMVDSRLRCDPDSAECKAQPEDRRCTGHLRDCQKMPKYSQVCHSPPGSERRYDWLRESLDKNVALYGQYKSGCQNTQGVWNYIDPGMCLCTCDSEDRLVDRYFSLQDVVSDVKDNKVVTGIRITKDNHVFHIQIHQGKLGPNGTIIDTPDWKNISKISDSQLTDDKVSRYFYDGKGFPKKDLKYDEWVEFYKNDLVYTVWYNQTQVYLDTLDADRDRLITGLRFQHVDDSLRLEIQTTRFDYATGKLDLDSSSWTSNPNNEKARDELVLVNPDDPSKHYGSTIDSTDNQYVKFTMTDMEEDFGQFTAPFIDIQNVMTNPPLPLSGAGLIHKGRKGSGGFLGLKVIHFDYTDHL